MTSKIDCIMEFIAPSESAKAMVQIWTENRTEFVFKFGIVELKSNDRIQELTAVPNCKIPNPSYYFHVITHDEWFVCHRRETRSEDGIVMISFVVTDRRTLWRLMGLLLPFRPSIRSKS